MPNAGIQSQHLETIPSKPQSSSTTSPVGHNDPHTIPEIISSPRRASNSSHEDLSPLMSPLPKMSEEHTDSEAEEEKDNQRCPATVSEDENGEGIDDDDDEDGSSCRRDDDDGEEEEDYEEVVLKPRTLNEVTSLTDKTSPWTSIMSDPDLVSLESMEAPEEPDLSQDEEDKSQLTSQNVNLHAQQSGGKHGCSRQEEREHHQTDSFNGSAGDASDTERDGDRTLQALDEGQVEESNMWSGDTGSSPTPEHGTFTHDASCSLENQDTRLQLSVPAEVPNFFLPSHQLEASMRAIRLAPSFSQSCSDPGLNAPVHSIPRRSPRQRPDMSPSSMKKETERIAKIFAAHFDEDH